MHKNIHTHRIQFRVSDAYGLFSVVYRTVRGEVPCLACHLPCVTYRGGGYTAAGICARAGCNANGIFYVEKTPDGEANK